MNINIGQVGYVIAVFLQPANHVVFITRIENSVVLHRTWLQVCQVLTCSNAGRSPGSGSGIAAPEDIGPVERDFPGGQIIGCIPPAIERSAVSAIGPEVISLLCGNAVLKEQS